MAGIRPEDDLAPSTTLSIVGWSGWWRRPSSATNGESVPGVGRRYAATTRVVTLVPTVIVAIAAPGPGAMRLVVSGLMVIFTLWSVMYVREIRRPIGEWLTWIDISLLALLSVSVKWTVPASWMASGQSWLVPFVSFAAVSYQFYALRRTGAAAAVLLAIAMVAGLALALPAGTWSDSLITAAWSLVLCLLGRMLRVLVERGGRAARRSAAALEALRREQQVAQAVRSDERRMLDTLHDTAASTLLMVGVGAVDQEGGRTLVDRAARDLAVLESIPEPQAAYADLVESIRSACTGQGIDVGFEGPREYPFDGEVVRAIAGAAGEAVRNAARHAGTPAVHVRVTADGDGVAVQVTDRGRGFDPARVTIGRRGMRESIMRRMADVGGAAGVDSTPKAGTVVRLRWPA